MRRRLELTALRRGWLSSVLDHADVVSEGAPSADGSYYGSTSVRVRVTPELGVPAAELVQLFVHDAHARLLLLRIAHREAAVRARGQLGVMQVEIACRLVDAALSVDMDVSAPLLSPANRTRRK